MAAAWLLLSVANDADAIYTWVDDQGVTHMTDYPGPQKPSEAASPSTENEKGAGTAAVPRQAAGTEQRQAPARPSAAAVPASKGTGSGQQTVALPQALPLAHPETSSSPTVTQTSPPAQAGGHTEPAAVQQIPARTGAQAGTAREIENVRAMGMLFSSFFLYIVLLLHLYFSLCLFLIARKLNVGTAWLAWVPILQVFPMLASASKPWWWVLLFIVPFANLGVIIYVWMCITENLGKNKWLGLLIVAPFVGFFYPAVLAFSSQGRRDPDAAVS
jgi:hypothetical protein